MYKKQMILQRVVCYLCLAAAALVFVYSLGLVTDLYDGKFNYYAKDYLDGLDKVKVAGTEMYFYIQEFNQDFTMVGIGLILVALSQFLFRNNVRRKYYIANYITVGVNTVATIAASVWALNNIFNYKAQYLQVDFAQMQIEAEKYKFEYIESTFWFDVSVYVFALLLIATVLNIVNLVWKIMLMKSEKELIEAGKGV